MRRVALFAAAAAMTLGATAASAQPYGNAYGYHRNQDRREERQERREDRREYRQDRREDRREYRQWQRGQYLPQEYRNRTYIVTDYNRYGLAPPPRGYQYYRSGNNILLTAIASGLIGAVIASVLGNNGYSQNSYGYSQPSYGYSQPGYGYQQPYGYGQQRPIRGYDQYGRPYY